MLGYNNRFNINPKPSEDDFDETDEPPSDEVLESDVFEDICYLINLNLKIIYLKVSERKHCCMIATRPTITKIQENSFRQ